MKQKIIQFITDFAEEHDKGGLIENIWQRPLVCFGDAVHPEMEGLRQVVHPEHVMPWEILPDAKTIISYFIPFTEELGNGNRKGRLASREWAMAYEKTNAAFQQLNQLLIGFMAAQGIAAAVTKEAVRYDENLLKSKWSQRHIARLCGLGTFGKNNMLITESGCCGRFSSVVTDLDVEHDQPVAGENCLKYRSDTCGACVARCPSKALTEDGFKREICNELCAENGETHVGYGSSYAFSKTGENLAGTNVCGKCVVGMPCTFRRP